MKRFLAIVLSLILVLPAFAQQNVGGDLGAAMLKNFAGDYVGAAADIETLVAATASRMEFTGKAHSFLIGSYLNVPDVPAAMTAARNALSDPDLALISAGERERVILYALNTLKDNGTDADVDAGLADLLNVTPIAVAHVDGYQVSTSPAETVATLLKFLGNKQEVIGMLLPKDAVGENINNKYLQLGRANDPAAKAAITQLNDGGAARPLTTSARLAGIGVLCDNTKAGGKFWQLYLAGSYQLAAQHAWDTARLPDNTTKEFGMWIEMIIFARISEGQHFNDTLALDFAKWQNADPDVPTNPLDAWLTP